MLRKNVEKAKSQYDDVPAIYSKLITSCYRRVNQLIDLEYEKCISEAKDKTVLDVACGDGRYTKMMLDKGARLVVGVDESEQMIRICRERIASKRLILRAADISRFDLADIKNSSGEPLSYDLVYTFAFWHYLPTSDIIRSTASNLSLRLTPEGTLYALVLDSDYIPCWSNMLNVWSQRHDSMTLTDGDPIYWNYRYEGKWLFPQNILSYYWHNDSLKQLLEGAGLKEELTYNISDANEQTLNDDEFTTLRVWRISKYTKMRLTLS